MVAGNVEYLLDFVKKHSYSKQVTAGYSGGKTTEHIDYIIFNEKDIPSRKKVRMDDIRYDIDTNLPPDVFFRWLEYCDTHEDQPSYIYWMTKMANNYEPMGIDKSGSEEFRKELTNALNLIKDKLEGYRNSLSGNKKNG